MRIRADSGHERDELRPRERATRASWKTEPRPAKTAELKLALTLTAAEYQHLRYGFVPQEMEDKWFVYELDRTVHLHRSWTGLWFASVKFEETPEGYRAATALVNREPAQHAGTDDAADAAMIEAHCRRLVAENRDLARNPRLTGPLQNRQRLEALLASHSIALEPAPFLDSAPPPLSPSFDFDRIEGMLLGLAVGDALGNTSEGLLPSERRSRHGEITHYLPNDRAAGRAVGLPSDDSQLAFWTLEQLNADGGLVPERLARRLTAEPIFGIGHGMKQFVRRFKDQKLPWEKAGADSAGNGALMRIAPVLIPHLASPSPDLWADTAIAAMVTHNDRSSTAACLAFVSLLWSALQLDEAPAPGFWLDRFVEVAGALEGATEMKPRFGPHVGRFKGPLTRFVDEVVRPALETGRSLLNAADEWGTGAYLLETVPTVLYILERHAHEPQEAILRAVNDTKDNDTIAAIVGAAMGALHGRRALRPEWIRDLTGRTGDADDGRVFELIAEARECWEPRR